MKKRVISSFLALLVFALILLAVQKLMFGQIVSFSSHAVINPEEDNEMSFDCNILSIEKSDPLLKVIIECQDFQNQDREIKAIFSYPGIANEQATFKEQKIILTKGSKNQYSFSLPYPQKGKERTLQMKATSNDEVILRTKKMVISRSITGNVIADNFKQQLANLPLLIFSLIALLLVSKFILNHHKRTTAHKHYRKGVNRHLIKLNLEPHKL